MVATLFGQLPDGQPVHAVPISGGGLTATILTYGAVLQDLRLDWVDFPLVIGFPTLKDYLAQSPYIGATVGRFANRIGQGHLDHNGQEWQLDQNDGQNHLHGGKEGFSFKVWRIDEATENRVLMSLASPHLDSGYPGKLDIWAEFSLNPGGVLDIRYRAVTDRPTICNISHHSYFKLSDEKTILDHDLTVFADEFTPVGPGLIPTGEVRPVAGTPLDFRAPTRVGDVAPKHPIDVNFCFPEGNGELRTIGRLTAPKSGVTMEIRTTEPGLQVYDGMKLSGPGQMNDGNEVTAHGGMALEPQNWPDAPNHKNFPDATLRPGELYEHRLQYVFSRGAN